MYKGWIPILWSLLALASFAGPGDGPSLTWKGKSHPVSDLPEDLPAAARATAEAWSSWASEMGHVMHLDETGQVMLVGPDDRSRIRRSIKLINDTVELFEELLPLPAEPEPVEEAAVLASAELEEDVLPEDPEDYLPEDPEIAPRGAEVSSVDSGPQGTAHYSWGGAELAPNTQVAVMCVLEDIDEYNKVLDFLARQQPYLLEWKAEAKGQVGFAIEMPLCGAYVLNAEGMEEWSPENELVHRVMRLLVMRRFAQQPYWLSVGLSWHAELELRRGIYCFPYRDEFISVMEHSDWNRVLRSWCSKRDEEVVAMSEFANWQPGSYQDGPAKMSWGAVDYMARVHADTLPALMEDLRLYWDRENRKVHSDGTWERVPGFTIPADTQRQYIEKHMGPDFLVELTNWWRTGKLPKRKKK